MTAATRARRWWTGALMTTAVLLIANCETTRVIDFQGTESRRDAAPETGDEDSRRPRDGGSWNHDAACPPEQQDSAVCRCAALAGGPPRSECVAALSRPCMLDRDGGATCLVCADTGWDAPRRVCLRCGEATDADYLVCRTCAWEDMPQAPCTRCADRENRTVRDECVVRRREAVVGGVAY